MPPLRCILLKSSCSLAPLLPPGSTEPPRDLVFRLLPSDHGQGLEHTYLTQNHLSLSCSCNRAYFQYILTWNEAWGNNSVKVFMAQTRCLKAYSMLTLIRPLKKEKFLFSLLTFFLISPYKATDFIQNNCNISILYRKDTYFMGSPLMLVSIDIRSNFSCFSDELLLN